MIQTAGLQLDRQRKKEGGREDERWKRGRERERENETARDRELNKQGDGGRGELYGAIIARWTAYVILSPWWEYVKIRRNIWTLFISW